MLKPAASAHHPASAAEVAATPAQSARQRNPRGQGQRLREEIIAGATSLLERTGSEESITMRAVAREVGIAAPSVTPHFSDPGEIIDAVVTQELIDLHEAMGAAVAAHDDPIEQLLAGARAYVAQGRTHPNRYRVIFERRFAKLWELDRRVMQQTEPLMAESFDLAVRTVQACIDAGCSTSTDAFGDGVRVWLALHGLVALPQTITSFPWPDTDELLVSCVTRLAQLTPAGRRRGHDGRLPSGPESHP